MYWGKLIHDIRQTCGLKQEAAAELLGVAQTTLSRWESGRTTPSVAIQSRILQFVKDQRQKHHLQDDLDQIVQSTVGMTCTLIHAASIGDLNTLQEMIAAGIGPDCSDYDLRTPLHLAAAEGHTDIVSYLLAQGADIHPHDRWGATPIDSAIYNRHWPIVELLAKFAPDTEQADFTAPSSSLRSFQAIQAASAGDLAMLRHLHLAGIDLDCADYDARTPLHLAAAEGHEETVDFLLSSGANPHSVDRWGATPADSARQGGHEKIATRIKGHNE